MAGMLLPLLGVLLVSTQQASADITSRRLMARPFGGRGSSTTCRNTLQGPWYLTDDQGVLCPAADMDYATGCCSKGQKHTCDSCTAHDSCCAGYEQCVSCCMAPANGAASRLKGLLRVNRFHGVDAGAWSDEFDYCRGVCRTHSRSTLHENAYIAPRHHCFSKLGKPMLSQPLPPGALDGVTVVLGAAGAPCDTVCAQQGKACSEPHLSVLNNCDRLQEHSNCEAGCLEEAHTAAMPCYMSGKAPKPQRPALCLVSKAPAAGLSCSASEQHAQRLCPCGDAAKASTTGQGDASQAAGTKSVAGPGDAAAVQEAKPAGLAAAAAAPQGAKAQEPLSAAQAQAATATVD